MIEDCDEHEECAARSHAGRRAVAWLTLIGALLGSLAYADEEAAGGRNGEEELNGLRASIIEARERVGAHEREERELFDVLEEADRLIESLGNEVALARRQATGSRKLLETARAHEARLRERLDQTRELMSRRVVALYKSGEIGPVRVLFSSDSMPEMMSRMSILEKLIEYDGALVKRYSREWSEVEGANRAANARAEEWEAAAARFAERSDQLVAERTSKAQLLARVRDDRTVERKLLVELEKAARVLEETLATLGATSRDSALRLAGLDFASFEGKLAWPVAARVSRHFGRIVDAQYLTETFRKGVEFAAAEGDSVRAVAPGAVRYVGWFRGYGKIVIIDHGAQYFTVSGHLAETFVEVDGLVDEGDTVGSVGETGSFSGPNLYFEIRRGSQPLDPATWLAPEAGSVQAQTHESG